MSLLGSQVYANPSKPLWISAGSPASLVAPVNISGNATAINAYGEIKAIGFPISQLDGAGTYTSSIISSGGTSLFQFPTELGFPKIGSGAFNTSLTNSAAGANADVFLVGGDVVAKVGSVKVQTAAGTDSLVLGDDATGSSLIESTQPILFTQVGAGGVGANSSLTISAATTNADVLFIGGKVECRELDLNDAGPAAVIGRATLVAGQVVVNTTACDVTSYIFLTRTNLNASTAVGTLRVSNKGANDFTVNSVDATGAIEVNDVSDFDWVIINSA